MSLDPIGIGSGEVLDAHAVILATVMLTSAVTIEASKIREIS